MSIEPRVYLDDVDLTADDELIAVGKIKIEAGRATPYESETPRAAHVELLDVNGWINTHGWTRPVVRVQMGERVLFRGYARELSAKRAYVTLPGQRRPRTVDVVTIQAVDPLADLGTQKGAGDLPDGSYGRGDTPEARLDLIRAALTQHPLVDDVADIDPPWLQRGGERLEHDATESTLDVLTAYYQTGHPTGSPAYNPDWREIVMSVVLPRDAHLELWKLDGIVTIVPLGLDQPTIIDAATIQLPGPFSKHVTPESLVNLVSVNYTNFSGNSQTVTRTTAIAPVGSANRWSAKCDVWDPGAASDAADLADAGVVIANVVNGTFQLPTLRALARDMVEEQFLAIVDHADVYFIGATFAGETGYAATYLIGSTTYYYDDNGWAVEFTVTSTGEKFGGLTVAALAVTDDATLGDVDIRVVIGDLANITKGLD